MFCSEKTKTEAMVYTQVIKGKLEQGHIHQEVRMMVIFKEEGRVRGQGRTLRRTQHPPFFKL